MAFQSIIITRQAYFNTVISVVAAMLAFTDICFSQNRNLHQNTRIEEAAFIKLGTIEQWVTIRGDNDDAPVLLLLLATILIDFALFLRGLFLAFDQVQHF
jgi:hypothetical protein